MNTSHDQPDQNRPDDDVERADGATEPAQDRSAPPPRSAALIALIAAIPAMVIVGFITYAVLGPSDGSSQADKSTPLDSMSAPQSTSAECTSLVAALPKKLDGYRERTEHDGLITWKSADDDSGAVRLRCGVDRPTSLVSTSVLTGVDSVQWFTPDSDDTGSPASSQSPTTTTSDAADGALWYAVDRRPYVAIWLPSDAGNGPISQISDAVNTTMPATTVDVGS